MQICNCMLHDLKPSQGGSLVSFLIHQNEAEDSSTKLLPPRHIYLCCHVHFLLASCTQSIVSMSNISRVLHEVEDEESKTEYSLNVCIEAENYRLTSMV